MPNFHYQKVGSLRVLSKLFNAKVKNAAFYDLAKKFIKLNILHYKSSAFFEGEKGTPILAHPHTLMQVPSSTNPNPSQPSPKNKTTYCN